MSFENRNTKKISLLAEIINSAHKFEAVEYVTFGLMCDVMSKNKTLFYIMSNMIILQKVKLIIFRQLITVSVQTGV